MNPEATEAAPAKGPGYYLFDQHLFFDAPDAEHAVKHAQENGWKILSWRRSKRHRIAAGQHKRISVYREDSTLQVRCMAPRNMTVLEVRQEK